MDLEQHAFKTGLHDLPTVAVQLDGFVPARFWRQADRIVGHRRPEERHDQAVRDAQHGGWEHVRPRGVEVVVALLVPARQPLHLPSQTGPHPVSAHVVMSRTAQYCYRDMDLLHPQIAIDDLSSATGQGHALAARQDASCSVRCDM